MANRKHLALLKRGVEAWNAWRRKTPQVRPNLSGAALFGATLCGADLRGADLRGADLSYAILCGADLSQADLRGADLFWASLDDANLTRASLSYADLRGTGLSEADLTDALGWLPGVKRPEAVERQEMGVGEMARACPQLSQMAMAAR